MARKGPAPFQPKTRYRQIEIFDFCRRDDKVMIPDTSRHPPLGELLKEGQATQGTGWMPWRQEPMKDVAGDEMPRGAASKH
jgi:hypothetical protein